MEREHIESLVADQVLGELSAPASWLLERYLAEHPEHAGDAEQVKRTIELAKSALSNTEPAEAPLPPMPRLRPHDWTARMRSIAWPAACAACLLLGWLLGPATPMVRQATDRTTADVVQRTPVTSGHASTTVAAASDGQFWSVRSWVERSSRSFKTSATASGIVWKAPFQVASN